MLFQSVFILAAAFSASVAANSDLCLQGCCGLAFKLPSTSLTLHHLTIDKSSVQVPLKASELPCCPCDDTLGQPQSLFQPKLLPDDIPGCLDGRACNNDTHITPALPPNPKPKGSIGNAPEKGGNAPEFHKDPCGEDQCWSDCECATGMSPMGFFIASAVKLQAPAILAVHKDPCMEDQCHCDCACAEGMKPTEDCNSRSSDDSKEPPLNAGSDPSKDGANTSSADGTKASSSKGATIPPCAEGQCFSDCECSVDGLMAFINPGTPIASMPRVCASGECSTDCICRDDLVKTAQVVASLKKHANSSKSKKVANQKVLADKTEL